MSNTLHELAAIIKQRRSETAEKSYTKSLLEAGPLKCAKKLGEEATETVIAAVAEDKDALKNEASDLLYHLLVLLESKDVPLEEVEQTLASRMGLSGHEEKARRQSS
jgi:phosphoribosyl-ATP pyrophosphohydrolase